jgi:hypothetical protein
MKYILDPTKLRTTIAGGCGDEHMWYQILNYKKSDAGKASQNYIDTGVYTTTASVIAHNKAIAEKAKLLENARFGDTYLDNAYAQAAAAQAKHYGNTSRYLYNIARYISNGNIPTTASEADALDVILAAETSLPDPWTSKYDSLTTTNAFEYADGKVYQIKKYYRNGINMKNDRHWFYEKSERVGEVTVDSAGNAVFPSMRVDVTSKDNLMQRLVNQYREEAEQNIDRTTYQVNPDVKLHFDDSTTSASPIIDYYEKTGDTSPTVASPLQQVVDPDPYEKTGDTTPTTATMSDAALNALYEKAIEDYNNKAVNNVVNPDVNTQFGTDSTSVVVEKVTSNNPPGWDPSKYKQWNIPTGSGDAQINPSWNKSFTSSLGELFSTDSLADNGTGTVINTYNISKSSDDFMERLTSNTFNVRSEKIENMLNGMLTLMRERRNKSNSTPKRTATTRSRNQNREGIFTDENIPRQIERLSVG